MRCHLIFDKANQTCSTKNAASAKKLSSLPCAQQDRLKADLASVLAQLKKLPRYDFFNVPIEQQDVDAAFLDVYRVRIATPMDFLSMS